MGVSRRIELIPLTGPGRRKAREKFYIFLFRLLREKPLSQCGVFVGGVEGGMFLRNPAVLLHDYTAS